MYPADDARPIRLSELVSALSIALDLVEGQPIGHSVRSAAIGLRIAEALGLSAPDRRDLYYALLMKDAGCSNNAARFCQILGGDEIAAKADVKSIEWTSVGLDSLRYAWRHVARGQPLTRRLLRMVSIAWNQKAQGREIVQLRCDRGAAIAERMGFSRRTAEAIRYLDEHWDGSGYPEGFTAERIPQLSRILSLSQTLDVHWTADGEEIALDVIAGRSGRWFDPELVAVAEKLAAEGTLFEDLGNEAATRRFVLEREPAEDAEPVGESRIDDICEAFASVVDAKSPYTYRHSIGVAAAAVCIGETLGLPAPERVLLRRAGLLHDLGKLSVPSSILEKPGSLTPAEWAVVRKHPRYTLEILSRIPGFEILAEVAASHHEKLDGSGYWRGLTAPRLSVPARILAVADVYDALAATRPYRSAMRPWEVLDILQQETPHGLDATCVAALRERIAGGVDPRGDAFATRLPSPDEALLPAGA
jgi:putative nucleotidyltransferase with HDIG domain